MFQRKAGRFYPTRLALNIASSQEKGGPVTLTEGDAPKGYIVVETNYRVYAYTDSNLQVALLGLFTELLYRYSTIKKRLHFKVKQTLLKYFMTRSVRSKSYLYLFSMNTAETVYFDV